MILFLGVELAVGVIGAIAFIVAFGPPWRSHDRAFSWHISSFSAALLAELFCFLLLTLGVPVSPWAFAVVFAALDAVIGWRLWLLLSLRRRKDDSTP